MIDIVNDLNGFLGAAQQLMKPVIKEQQNTLLMRGKLRAMSALNTTLANNPDAIQHPEKMVEDLNNSLNVDGLNQSSKDNLHGFVSNIAVGIQQQQTSRLAAAAQRHSLDLSANSFNVLRNSVSAGQVDTTTALKLFNEHVYPGLKNTMGAAADPYAAKAKSSLMLEGLKGMALPEADKVLRSDQYIKGMTHDDYLLGQKYISSRALGMATGQGKILNLQKRIAKGIMDGTMTSDEINVLKHNETQSVSDVIGNTAQIMDSVKEMNYQQLSHFIEEDKVDPGLRVLLKTRLQSMAATTSKDLIGWGMKNNEVTPLDFSQSPTNLKMAMQKRLNDISEMEQKYSTPAQQIFTPQERQQLKYSFSHSTDFNKVNLIHTIGDTINPARYKDIDSSLYPGAAADMLSAQTNPNADGIIHDSIRGADMLKANPKNALSKKNLQIISSAVAKIYAGQPLVQKTLVNQLQNVAVARGYGHDGELIGDDVVKKLVHDSTDAHIEEGTSNSSGYKTSFLSKDEATSNLLGYGLFNDDIANTIGSAKTSDWMRKADGSPISTDDVNKYGQFHTLAPGVYTCIITPRGKPSSLLRTKDGAPVIFHTDHLTDEQKTHISRSRWKHPITYIERKI